MQVAADGATIGCLHGNLPTFIQDSGVAELWAFLMTLRFGLPPLEVVTDYKGLIDGIALGPEECTAANRMHADIWKLIWEAVQDFGLCYITVRKVKAHVALARIRDGSVDCSWLDWFGNRVADSQAKQGAACHPVEKELQQILVTCSLLVTGVARWLGTIGDHLMALDGPDVQARSPKAPSKMSLELTHIPAFTGDQVWRPIVLHKEAKNVLKAGPELQDGQRRGRPRLGIGSGPDAADRSHDLRKVGGFVFCHRCGGHTTGKTSRVLANQCKGKSMQTCHRRLREGRHPLTDEVLGPVTRWQS